MTTKTPREMMRQIVQSLRHARLEANINLSHRMHITVVCPEWVHEDEVREALDMTFFREWNDDGFEVVIV